ncbi:hypothetical protein [Oryzobacter terrae]|uniref:hypothetical protein n=1 Tax=Oryzobacter terrae TaxID=1620385 RepID=UPI003672C2A7
MSPTELGTALRDLVDGVEDDALAPAPADLWRHGSRRRGRTRAVAGLAAASVAAMVALLAWPAGEPRASVPADGTRVVDGRARLTAFPENVAMPPSTPTSSRPGRAALVLPVADDDGVNWYAVAPTGGVSRLPLAADSVESSALSPDGRWLATGHQLHDLVDGRDAIDADTLAALENRRTPSTAVWWSPDSSRAYVAGFGEGSPPPGMGVVLDVDGGVTEVPLLLGGIVAVDAGWLDDETLVSLAGLGPRVERLQIHTWRVGDADWSTGGPIVSWLGGPRDGDGGVVSVLRASVSPDGSRMVLTASLGRDGTASELSSTRAVVVDPRTGGVLGLPSADGAWPSGDQSGSYAEWEGWGCRPAWRNGLPLVTDHGVRPVNGPDDELVRVSSRFGGACPVFAGDELSGSGVPNTMAVWEERAWVFGLPLLVVALVGLVGWRASRRRNRWRERPRWLPMIYVQRF